jgi:long-subunit acyl-CoA synthetase (AMP-forming)
LPRPFTIEADELTVSLKLRRSFVLQRHADRLEKMYRDAGEDEAQPELG